METSKMRKLKHGSLSIILTACFVALVIAFNYFMTAIEDKVTTQIDISDKGYFNISNASRTALDTLDEDWHVDIIFLAQRDVFVSTSNSTIFMIRYLAEEYERQFSGHVSVLYKDLNKDRAFVAQYMDEARTELTTTQVIIKGAHHARVLSFSAFFLHDADTSELTNFQGELKYTSAILQVSLKEQPLALFTTGHGETLTGTVVVDETTTSVHEFETSLLSTADDAVKEEMISRIPLLEILSVAGFDIAAIDLTKESIDENARTVVVSNPKYDFMTFDSSNPNVKTEIDKLDDYVDSYRSLVVLVGADTPKLPNLSEYLWESYGMDYVSGDKIYDSVNCVAGGDDVAYDGYSVMGQLAGAEYSLAANVHTNVSSSAKVVLRNAVKLLTNSAVTGVEPAVTTYSTAQVYRNGTVTENGVFPLVATYSKSETNSSTGARSYGSVFLIASTEFVSTEFASQAFGNREILLGMARIMNTIQNVPEGISEIRLIVDDNTLSAEKLTSGLASRYARIIALWIPLCIIILGAVVWVKRRHS